MKVSTRGRYGLRVMMELAGNYGKGPMPVVAIAKNQDISGKYIHVIVMGLRSAGLVRTLRGPSGGYELARAPAEITALDVVAALEGRNAPVECVADEGSCPRTGRCAARDVWCDVASAIDGVLSALTLEQLAARQRAKAEEQPSYCI
ncbi:MAG: RrF2 family transcriptional regulator [Polyangia bacterium]|jgi:Rrf2 family protein|nr:RrF2 family transcriptional regulator [Polyangia bacterium]